MTVKLQYGAGWIEVDVPAGDVTVLEPKFVEGLQDEEQGFIAAVRDPIESRPMRDLVSPAERLALVIPDITRPLATDRLLRWTLKELSHIPDRRITIINGTGSHRANTNAELASMVGNGLLARVRVVNHTAHDPATVVPAGKTPDGRTVLLNREYVEADRRIVLGFIEPHFMAGFSGGYKGIFPALADIDSIMHYHRASVIGDPCSTWGQLEGNPTQEQVRANGSLLPVDFCINVTQNRNRCITGFFCGAVPAAHRRGCEFARATAMVACERSYPIVVTSNSGYPLDQNLYQSVKGMSAAAQIVSQGGLILTAAECRDGFPAHGNFRKLMCEHDSPAAILRTILAPGFSLYDQWEAQMLAQILMRARVGLYSTIAPDDVQRAHLEPVADIEAYLQAEQRRIGTGAPVAVIPEGPMTIPYLESRD
ncbi:MAG: nickel-dependent lactate racemase [Acidobacteriia bacterium]|nr:nickel-dependent lactate racemase [Terriglobia bacterium]